LFMDFALGPNQGQGVPAPSDDRGLQWDLVRFTMISALTHRYTPLQIHVLTLWHLGPIFRGSSC
jgi:hypothetical protein